MSKIFLVFVGIFASNLGLADAFCESNEAFISQERKCIPPQNKGRDYSVVVETQDMYGAIAVDTQSGFGGGGFRALNASRAAEGALEICKKSAIKNAGVKAPINCMVVEQFKNACGSVAAVKGSKKNMIVWASAISKKNKQDALDRALEACDKKAAKVNILDPEPCGLWFGLCSK